MLLSIATRSGFSVRHAFDTHAGRKLTARNQNKTIVATVLCYPNISHVSRSIIDIATNRDSRLAKSSGSGKRALTGKRLAFGERVPEN